MFQTGIFFVFYMKPYVVAANFTEQLKKPYIKKQSIVQFERHTLMCQIELRHRNLPVVILQTICGRF